MKTKLFFSDEAHFLLNGYVNKQNYRFWGTENPNISISKSTFISSNQQSLGIITKSCWRQSSSPLQRREIGLRLLILCKMEQRAITPKSVRGYLQCIWKSSNWFRYPKFAHGGIEWPPYSPDLNPCDFLMGLH